MEFNDFLHEYRSKYADCDTDLAYFSRLAVVKFEKDERGNISGKCRFGLVFRHRDSESCINEGETWVCELEENYKANAQYFGKGVMKVDSSFIFDLRQDQMKLIADTLWRNYSSYFDGVLAERYAEEIENLAAEKANEKILSMSQTIEIQAKEIESLRERNRKLTSENEDHERMMTVMMDRRSSAGSVHYPIKRIYSDTLYSEEFCGRYDVRISADGTRLAIIPDENGKIESRDRMMRLAGLNDFMPFTGVTTLPVVFGDDGMMTVMI